LFEFNCKKRKKSKKIFLHTENGSQRRSGYTYPVVILTALAVGRKGCKACNKKNSTFLQFCARFPQSFRKNGNKEKFVKKYARFEAVFNPLKKLLKNFTEEGYKPNTSIKSSTYI
jgi:hypothetical protein